MYRIISIDPGDTIGVAGANIDPYTPEIFTQFHRKDLPQLLNVIKEYQPAIIIIEQFRVYPSQSRSLSWSVLTAPEVIGALQQYASENKINIHFQNHVERLVVKPKILKHFGFNERGLPHAKEAARHLIAHLMLKHQKRFIEVIKDVAFRKGLQPPRG